MDEINKLASQCRVASPHDSVFNSECVYTFHTPYTSDQGILVNLNSFVGTVQELSFGSDSNLINNGALFLRIVKKREEKENNSKELNNDGTTEDEKDEEMKTERSSSITKLGVGIEGGFQSESDKFETLSTYSILVLFNNPNDVPTVNISVELPYHEHNKEDFPEKVRQSAESIIHHSGYSVQQDLSAWELDTEPIPLSKYYESIPYVDNGVKISPKPADWKCQASGDIENLWLNLSDGYIGGGRKNWDGSGGSNGALDHYMETGEKFPLVVKLGTITQDVSVADCYSYAKDEDGPVKIPNLAELLEKRGIKVSGMQKTVKSTAELEVELNATYAFDAITEAGAELVPIAGPGLQGLQNLGNSCYLNSVCQTLFNGTIPELSERYRTNGADSSDIFSHPIYKSIPGRDAASDVLCQATKMTNALTSGVFVGPLPDSATVIDATSESTNPKYRLAPRMFKNAFAQGHCDFVTGQQQDAVHYLQHLLETLDKAESSSDLLVSKENDCTPCSNLFSFKTISKLVCSADNLIKYKENAPETVLSLSIPVEKIEAPNQKRLKSENNDEMKTAERDEIPSIKLKSCLDAWAATTIISDMRWQHLQNASYTAFNQNKFGNFPPYLFVSLQRYRLGADWVPEKLEVNVEVPEEIDLNYLKSTGPVDGEFLIPDGNETENSPANVSTPAPKIIISESALDQLASMGFGLNGCKRALLAVGGSNVENAMNWIFEHNMDPDFNDPPQEEQAASASSNIDESVVDNLVNSLGCFASDQVRAALEECDSDAARAADWLFSNMDNLDEAIALSKAKKEAATSSPKPAADTPLQDGDGKYNLIGLISHIGKHTGSGHYVCHLKKEGKWVIFDDEKVALSETPPIQHAYIYLFKRKIE